MALNAEQQYQHLIRLYTEEEQSRKPVVSRTDIPFSYERITREWLTDVICRETQNAEVVGFSLDQADNGTSNRRRIFLNYNRVGEQAGLPSSVFCKATHSLDSRFVLGVTGMAEAEIIFYRDIRSMLDIEAPRYIFANIDRDSLNSIIILEDMADRVQFCSHDTPVSFEQAKSQMDVLAEVHARFYESPELEKTLAHYQDFHSFVQTIDKAINWSDTCKRGFVAAKSVIPPRLFSREQEVWPASQSIFAMHDVLPKTLIHNDVHLKNWYIVNNHTMGLSDWQCVVKGHWSRDVAYTLSTALTTENRRAWEFQLIEHYVNQLAARGGPVIPLAQANTLYRQQLFAALAWWTGTIVHAEEAPEMQPIETSLEFISRISTAIDDLDALDAAFQG